MESGNTVDYDVPEGVQIIGRYDQDFSKILSKDAIQFVADLQREFKSPIKHAMNCREEAQMRYNKGELPGFDPAMKHVREGRWFAPRWLIRGLKLWGRWIGIWSLMPLILDPKFSWLVIPGTGFTSLTNTLLSFLVTRPARARLTSVDFGLYFFHNWSKFREMQGEGFMPFLYLPKMEHSM
ncbi:hypothetical protein ACS0TY_031168 [Phlomoides rotata]